MDRVGKRAMRDLRDELIADRARRAREAAGREAAFYAAPDDLDDFEGAPGVVGKVVALVVLVLVTVTAGAALALLVSRCAGTPPSIERLGAR